jgi:UDP-2,4-diacetamido-2,4,6-trideoxy-beta-L-altropyranose hydrolase
MNKKAFFRFEAAPEIGAGHAIRSCVIADELVERGWDCQLVTSPTTYEFINHLKRLPRVDPEEFYQNPMPCDLLVIDHYGLDASYEKHFKPFANKIMVIDDLANRPHACDILLDQTYGRTAKDYQFLVPTSCKILTGVDYVLLRKELIILRPKALLKRRNTKNIERILVSFGGNSPVNCIMEALELIQGTFFEGEIDVVLGFEKNNQEVIRKFIKTMQQNCTLHIDVNMSELIYQADLAIGAVGGSVWERACLGLPQVLMVTADNQKANFSSLEELGIIYSLPGLLEKCGDYSFLQKLDIDGFGINRVINSIEESNDSQTIHFRKVTPQDRNKIYLWQQIKEIRKYFNNPNPPSLDEHNAWFSERIKQYESPYWMICHDNEEYGIFSLSYNYHKHVYDLSWFIIPEKRGRGFGTQAVKCAIDIIHPFKIRAFVNEDNVASHKVFKSLNFLKTEDNYYISNP